MGHFGIFASIRSRTSRERQNDSTQSKIRDPISVTAVFGHFGIPRVRGLLNLIAHAIKNTEYHFSYHPNDRKTIFPN